MFHINIITHSGRIENIGNTKFEKFSALTSKTESTYYTEGLKFRKRMYQLKFGLIRIDVYCPEINVEYSANGLKYLKYLILPEFVVPGRRFPIYIYIFAIMTYCANKKMGQREAAKRTREYFGLKTFSHTTLGRTMKKLEQLIKKHDGEMKTQEEATEEPEPAKKKFPTVEQTKARKDRVASYLINAAGDSSFTKEVDPTNKQTEDNTKPPYKGIFIDACHRIVNHIFLRYRCLLL